MKHTTTHTQPATTFVSQAAFAKALTAKLSLANNDISPDVATRLQFARQRALDAHMALQTQTAPAWQTQSQTSGSFSLGSAGGNTAQSGFNFDNFGKWSSFLPLLALLAGLFAINHFQTEMRAKDVAEIDSALLTDDLPPAAYADQGFGQFLKLQLQSEGRE
jgi:Protein of unknown function (DUF3619)